MKNHTDSRPSLVAAALPLIAIGPLLFAFVVRGDELGFDLTSTQPIQLIEMLKSQVNPIYLLSISRPVDKWVKEADLPALVALLDSDEVCAPVKLVDSSTMPRKSTVGDQAAFLIQGFRSGRYPPELYSPKVTVQEKEEIRAWWKARAPDSSSSPPHS